MELILNSLSIRLVNTDPSWVSLLGSEGLEWIGGHIDLSAQKNPTVLVFPTGTPYEDIQKYSDLIFSGATAICEPSVWPNESITQQQSIRMPYDNRSFCGLEGLAYDNAVEIKLGRFGLGTVFRLPFSLKSLWTDKRIGRRFVNIGNGQTIYEDMVAVVKKNVRRVIIDVIKRSFFVRGLPFLHKWYFPGRSRSVFCFRGDADGGPRENLQTWLSVLRPYTSSTSLFFCTSMYEQNQDLIAAAASAGFEVGSHNHWHIIFPDRLTNRISLIRAQQLLTNSCQKPLGFVAPAYFWHPTMYKALEEEGYLYSSCFGLSHDSLPYFPVIENRLGSVLEVPFHCLGDRFPRFNIPLDSKITRCFFSRLIEKKYAAGEPMLLYGHPDIKGRMGAAPELLQMIIEAALSHSDVCPLQLSKYADWWCKRNNFKAECWYDVKASMLKLRTDSEYIVPGVDLMLRVEFPDGGSYLIDPVTYSPNGLSREAMLPFPPLSLPLSCDIGEVVYQGPDPSRSIFSWQTRRTIQRFARAYSQVYLPYLNHYCGMIRNSKA